MKKMNNWDIVHAEKLEQIQIQAIEAGGRERHERQHRQGKLTARERLNMLFDEGTFQETDMLTKSRQQELSKSKKHFYGDGVVTGYGEIHGRLAFGISQDSSVSGGAGGEEHIQKICRCLEMAIRAKAPFISLNESGGARIEEGIDSLAAYSKLFQLNTLASGYIPQIAAIMGNCAGGASYSPALHDFVFMVKNTSQMYITGPAVIKALTGEQVSMEELGGTQLHSNVSGQAHFVCENDEECLNRIRRLLSYLPQNCHEELPETSYHGADNSERIEQIVPENKKKPYDVVGVIESIVDEGTFFEVSKDFAANICIGFARMEGSPVGIIANQPNVNGGALDCDASDKGARFVRCCDCFNIPLICLVDVPAFMPGIRQEKKGIIRHGSKMLYAFSEASVPKVSLIMRKAYGGAYCAMNSKNLGADVVYAWPICEIAVMGADGAVNVIYKKQIEAAENPQDEREKLIEEYNGRYLNPYFAAEHALVDEIIKANQTRKKICSALKMLKNKTVPFLNKKHGNIPL